MKLSDYVVDFLIRHGIRNLFTVSGGGIMHLLDSVGQRQNELKYVCNYHEQACAISAEAYARVTGNIGVCLVTTGPGSTNALSAIAGAWVDSVPVLVISGQVRSDLIADYARIRQLGPQEINIVDMAKPVTKYATTILNPDHIRRDLEQAFSICVSGRPGPVWVNIPLDVQAALINDQQIVPFQAGATNGYQLPQNFINSVLAVLKRARRPILVLGNGVHLSNAQSLAVKLSERLNIPTLLTLGGMALLPEEHPLFMGRFGPIGQRYANFAIQNSDLILSVGASMSISCIGFNTSAFAPRATKIVVNVDASEIDKMRPTPDLGIVADAGEFMRSILDAFAPDDYFGSERWTVACQNWKIRYPTVTKANFIDVEHVNSYVFVDVLSNSLSNDDTILTGNSLDAWSVYQAFKVKQGQRVFTNINFGAMGWDLPAAIGACIASGRQRVILITGDGSFQFNIQELLTIHHQRLNIKIFIFNNRGYESIHSTQKNYFDGRFVGADKNSGVSNPDFRHIASAYGLCYRQIKNNDTIKRGIEECLSIDGPVLCEVNLAPYQGRSPRVMSRRREDGTLETSSLEKMYPFLPESEMQSIMNCFDNEMP